MEEREKWVAEIELPLDAEMHYGYFNSERADEHSQSSSISNHSLNSQKGTAGIKSMNASVKRQQREVQSADSVGNISLLTDNDKTCRNENKKLSSPYCHSGGFSDATDYVTRSEDFMGHFDGYVIILMKRKLSNTSVNINSSQIRPCSPTSRNKKNSITPSEDFEGDKRLPCVEKIGHGTRPCRTSESSNEDAIIQHLRSEIGIDVEIDIVDTEAPQGEYAHAHEPSYVNLIIEEYVEEYLKHNEAYVMSEVETEIRENRDAWIVGYVVVHIEHRPDFHIKFTELKSKYILHSFCSLGILPEGPV